MSGKRHLSQGAEPRSKRSKIQPIVRAKLRVGSIVRMTLRNFMCHSFLEVRFDQNVNFISGNNGSGKSAILTALVIGLGGKATVTNRGNSIKGFIKAGKKSGSIEIVLTNEGANAYKPQIYGNEIIVQRNITAAGSSAYKIKSASGEVVSTKARELQPIITGLNIQIDNPICILNQDTSRNFLSSSDPKMKYDLFIRATRLDVLRQEYDEGHKLLENAKLVYKDKKQELKKANTNKDSIKEKIEMYRRIEEMRNELNSLQIEFLWSKVKDSETDLDNHKEIVQKLKDQHSHLETNSTTADQQIAAILEQVNSYKQQIDQLKAAAEEQNARRHEFIRTMKDLKLTIDAKNRVKARTLKEIGYKENEKNSLEQELSNFAEKLSKMEQTRLENMRIITDLQGKVKEFQQLVDTYHNEILQSSGDIKRKEEESNGLSRELEDVGAKYNRTKENLKGMRQESDNPLAPYGMAIVKLVNAIEQNRNKFKDVPKGPLGSYVTVKDKQWTPAIEGLIGAGLLRAFCVSNKKDCDLLMSIMSQVWDRPPKPMIITSQFFHQVHNVAPNLVRKTSNGCISVFEAITVSDPVVMNCLIDQLSIENILLIPNFELAIEMMSDATRVPQNCKSAVTSRGDTFYPDPNYRVFGSKPKNVRYLQADKADIFRQYETTLAEYEGTMTNTKQRLSKVNKEINMQKQAVNELRVKMEKSKRASTISKQKITELQASLEEVGGSGNIHQLEQEIKDLTSQIRVKQGALAGIDEEIKELDGQVHEIKENADKLKENSYEDRIAALEREITEQIWRREEITTNAQFEKKRLQESKKKLEEAHRNLIQFQKTVDLHLQQAQYLGERVENVRTVAELLEKINTAKAAVRKFENERENLDELMSSYEKISNIVTKVSEVMHFIGLDLMELDSAYKKRSRHYQSTRDYFEHFVSHCFKSFLKMRQFKGSININFKHKALDMVVIPQQGSQGITPTTNLSGGERSFSTVAFLYSLWQCLDFPFYFLDEFDVFMDKANRSKVMQILIHHAKTHPDTQFVFLTPQDISFIDDDEVAIHRLEDPVRRLTQH